jgi:drug/metabolite transporter (DMT)-like permease
MRTTPIARTLAWPGVPLALSSAVLFGASVPLARILLGAGLDPGVLAGLLYLGSGAGLALVTLVQHVRRAGSVREARVVAADVPVLALVIVAGGVLGPILLFFGLARMHASAAALLLNVEGLATMAMAWILFNENVDHRVAIGAAALLGGAVVLSWSGGAYLESGAGFVLLACLAWGIDNNLTRTLSASDPIQIAMAKGLVAGAVNLSIALFLRGAAVPTVMQIAVSGVIGFFGYGVSLACFVLALRHLGTARTAAYFSTSPFVGAVLAVVLLGEPLSSRLLVAAVLMGCGVWLHVTEAHDHEHTHGSMEHTHRHVHDIHHQHEHAPDDPPGEPHTHWHRHPRLTHRHAHYPDLHHRHDHP